MALLGAQLVITLVMISIIQKLGPHFSLGRWLLCSTGLIRYLYPTDAELRQLANIPKDKSKTKKTGKVQSNGKTVEATFHIPRNLDVQLETAKVSTLDVVHLKYYNEYQWLLDFSLYCFVVYVITETYQIWFPIKDEVNLSMLWCCLVLVFAVKLLLTLTVLYFKGEESVGERSTCIVMLFVYLLISMMVLIIDENTLELGLEQAYTSFNNSASTLLAKQGLNSSGPASKIVLKFFIALWCGILGSLFTFPGLRIAKMHWDLLKYFRDRKIIQLFLNISFALPFLLIVLWIKPVSRNYLTTRVFTGMTEPLMKDHLFDIVRIVAIIFTVFLKIVLMPWYLQAYLDMAYHRTEMQKKEAGRITNVDYQKKIAAVFYYLCVVTIQYIAPLIMCLTLTVMYKTLGEYNWSALYREPSNFEECPMTASPTNRNFDPFDSDSTTQSISKSAAEFHLAVENIKAVFSANVFRGILGFSTWWCCFVYFATTSLGLFYQSYFTTT